jgi:hypothetical protein
MNPETTGSLNRLIIMALVVHIKTFYRGASHRSEAKNLLSIGRSDEMFWPSILSRVEKGKDHLGFRVSTVCEVVAAAVAAMAGKGKIIFCVGAAERLGNEVVECEE